jgi:predicted Zn-dependent protease
MSYGQKQAIDRTAVQTERAARPITEREEYYIGRGVAARILSTYPLYEDQETLLYLNLVGQTLALNSARPQTYGGYHFAVLDSHEINAFACPGGTIFVTRGMLGIVENEDELAAVLAHEISHVNLRHGLKSIKKARWTQVVATLGAEGARAYTGAEMQNLVNLFQGTIDDVFKTLVVRGYGRKAEFEADESAVGCLVSAGYDPRAFASLLARLRESKRNTEGGILATHPGLNKRFDLVDEMALATAAPPPPPERLARFTRLSAM